MILNIGILLATIAVMEVVAWASHKYLMHGPLWCWHESHHRPRKGLFEKNDLFAVVFSIPSIVCIYVGVHHQPAFLWVGLGLLGYGLVYFFFHDVLVHRRIRIPYVPRKGYMRRVVQAHLMHHSVHTKEGAVSFGFVYAPGIDKLKAELAALKAGREEAAAAR